MAFLSAPFAIAVVFEHFVPADRNHVYPIVVQWFGHQTDRQERSRCFATRPRHET
jgi:hypothetical protein